MNRTVIGPIVAAFVGIGIGVQCDTQKPIDDQSIATNHSAPPATPSEMVAEVAAVVVGRLSNRTVVERTINGTLLLQTRYNVLIEEVIKGPQNLQPGSSVSVSVAGGEKEFPSHLYRETIANADPLQLEGAYVIFMGENADGSLRPAWGIASFYDISSGTVRPTSRVFLAQAGRTAPTFLEQLRNH